MPSISSTSQAGLTVPAVMRRSALMILTLAAVGSWWLSSRGLSGIQDYYFFHQDLPLLLVGGAAMFAAARTPVAAGVAAMELKPRAVIALTIAAVALAYIGTWVVMNRYAMSRDEDMADFAARYMQQGLLGMQIPTKFHGFGKAGLPSSAGRFIAHGYWVSDYLPMNSVFRAAAGLVGDRWLAGPILLLIGIAATWKAARLLWPSDQAAALVAVVLAATSTQLIVNAMTPYATTAHFALNAVWIVCFLHGGRNGHAAAILCGLVAAGLHQLHFHLLFLSGFIIWMVLTHRKGLAILYAGAAIGYCVFWDIVWTQFILFPLFGGGPAPGSNLSKTLSDVIVEHLSRLNNLEPITSVARFLAWQNILTLPLVLIGVRAAIQKSRRNIPVSFAFVISLGIGLMLMPWQGFGYGYRYLHHLMPCIILLAAGGVVHLKASGVFLKRKLLTTSIIFAVCISTPFAMWRSHELLMPYANAYQILQNSPADVVIVDPLAGAYVQDIVRVRNSNRGPFLLDMSELSIDQIDYICDNNRVMIFDRADAKLVGIQGDEGFDTPAMISIRRKRFHMLERGCARPVPVTNI